MVDEAGPDDEGHEPREAPAIRGRERRQHFPWSRVLLACAIAGPPLAFGGVHSATVVAFLAIVLILWLRLCTRTKAELQVPVFVGLGLFASAITLAQWLPLAGVRELFAPGVQALVDEVLAGTNVSARPGLSASAADTAMEAARLFGLSVLFVAAAQLSWRVSAAIVTAVGTAVALVGFAHEAAGMDAIYGVYAAQDIDRAGVPALLGTFVNPNHQSGLLLLGVFSGAALAADQHAHGLVTADPGRVDRYGDRFLAAMAGVTIQIPALVLSLSRGALLAFLIVGPVAGWLALRRQGSGRRARRRRAERLSPARLIVAGGAIGLFLLVAQHGAWRELATLSSIGESLAESRSKLDSVVDALSLVSFAPLTGIGRGSFVDLFPSVQRDPSYVLATHLECAPATMIVEWGPWCGGLLLVGFAGWWTLAMWRGGPRSDRNARRVALLGLFAVALQNFADFSFEFLGVAAPAIALAGSLSPGPTRAWRPGVAAIVVGSILVAAIVLAATNVRDAYLQREAVNVEVLAGTRAADDVLARRPLDGRLHGLLARHAANAKEWDEARARATAATRARPGSVDAWLLLAAAEAEVGDPARADEATAKALELLHDPPDAALVAWLLQRYPDPERLAALGPARERPWRLLVDALAEAAPKHADALAAARARARPDDPEPLRMRHALALHAREPALALHHARLWRQLAPGEVAAHLAVARALRTFAPVRLAEARDALDTALVNQGFADLAERGLLEQELVDVLLALGDEASLARARTLLPDLLGRPASREDRRFREALVERVRAADRTDPLPRR
jgi:hypothetical protein